VIVSKRNGRHLETNRCCVVAPLAADSSRPVPSSRSLVRSARERVFFRSATVNTPSIVPLSQQVTPRPGDTGTLPIVIPVVVYFCVTYSTCTVRWARDIRLSRIIKCSIICTFDCINYVIVNYSILQRWLNSIPLHLQATYSTLEFKKFFVFIPLYEKYYMYL
jgi:hypothetical protein